jgi:diaminohydroxyphosphoribosylaminopyrimidine deaminase/5-amino-6-(5-phosphoribosylamino)uracil reductase
VSGARKADQTFMRRALRLARRGLGRTHPNPPVGAVVVRAGRIVGEGWHRRAGAPHAEAVALARAGRLARGATLYCTLEPCTVDGRTPPCAPAVIAAGIRRVVLGSTDVDVRVSGRGIRKLRAAGLTVTTGVEEERCDDLLLFYRTHRRTGRPWVRLKLASSLDGRIAARDGSSRWITGEKSRSRVHRWRDELDAILVGVGTVLADDPRLDCRRARGRDPIRVIADSRLRTPADARILTAGGAPVWLACTRTAPATRAHALVAAGAEVLRLTASARRVDPGALLDRLGEKGITSILVEGGGELAAGLLRAGLVDEICLFTAPLLIGGDGIPMIESLGVANLGEALRLGEVSISRSGDDSLLVARPRKAKVP